jgi:hypothetical protein
MFRNSLIYGSGLRPATGRDSRFALHLLLVKSTANEHLQAGDRRAAVLARLELVSRGFSEVPLELQTENRDEDRIAYHRTLEQMIARLSNCETAKQVSRLQAGVSKSEIISE